MRSWLTTTWLNGYLDMFPGPSELTGSSDSAGPNNTGRVSALSGIRQLRGSCVIADHPGTNWRYRRRDGCRCGSSRLHDEGGEDRRPTAAMQEEVHFLNMCWIPAAGLRQFAPTKPCAMVSPANDSGGSSWDPLLPPRKRYDSRVRFCGGQLGNSLRIDATLDPDMQVLQRGHLAANPRLARHRTDFPICNCPNLASSLE
ncbi:hypothetical protein B0H11DRAFT_501504 [Mycena galericulata]|nr:hypothetical protein B0H11DRAFT_501504 [Mycena galericulata]